MAEIDLGSFSTPDLVLSLIPGPLLLALLAGGILGVSTPTALAAGGLPASGAVGYALFLEPPVDDETADGREN
jgi:hypothetical protein